MVKKLVNGWLSLGIKLCNYLKFIKNNSGGGSYDDKNKGIKTGKWIEISDNFNNLT